MPMAWCSGFPAAAGRSCREIKEKFVAGTWPLFLHPFPSSDKYFLRPAAHGGPGWGIYLVDVFDNMLLLREEPGYALLEPIPLRPASRPPVIPDRIDLSHSDAEVFLQDVYHGQGMAGVPRGTVKQLRIFAYHFGYPGLAGPSRSASTGHGT